MPNLSKLTDGLPLPTYTNSVLLAANTPEWITVPTDDATSLKAKFVRLGSPVATDFYALALPSASNRVTNGTFAADSDWTKGTGWSIGAGVATATGAISTALSQTVSTSTPLVEGQAYYVTFTATRSAGTVTINIGGTAGTGRSSSATFSEIIVAGATQVVSFTTSGFTGTVDDVTVIPCARVPVDDTSGQAAFMNPTGFLLNGKYASICVVSAGTPIITASFYK